MIARLVTQLPDNYHPLNSVFVKMDSTTSTELKHVPRVIKLA